MGFWLGTLVFAVFEALGFGVVQFSAKPRSTKMCVGIGGGDREAAGRGSGPQAAPAWRRVARRLTAAAGRHRPSPLPQAQPHLGR